MEIAESQYEVDFVDLPASFDSAILEAELDARRNESHPTHPSVTIHDLSQVELTPRATKRPRPSSHSPIPDNGRPQDLGIPSGAYLDSDTYGPSRYGGIADFMRRKRQKQTVQDSNLLAAMRDNETSDKSSQSALFRGVSIYVRIPLMMYVGRFSYLASLGQWMDKPFTTGA
jgi:hypothetical protein